MEAVLVARGVEVGTLAALPSDVDVAAGTTPRSGAGVGVGDPSAPSGETGVRTAVGDGLALEVPVGDGREGGDDSVAVADSFASATGVALAAPVFEKAGP